MISEKGSAMNKKQRIVLSMGIISIALIIIFAPRYKITRINTNDYIITEQSSALYKQSKGLVRYHWDKIAARSGLAVLTYAALIFFMKEKNE
jgi:hypothetical protein